LTTKTRRQFEDCWHRAGKSYFRSAVKRSRPHLDDKTHRGLERFDDFCVRARAAGIKRRLLSGSSDAGSELYFAPIFTMNRGRFCSASYRDGRGEVEGFADDYAFVIQGLLDLYEASFDLGWLRFAHELQGANGCAFLG
jgi:uncharacterized protein YyaL (SSP411 family)